MRQVEERGFSKSIMLDRLIETKQAPEPANKTFPTCLCMHCWGAEQAYIQVQAPLLNHHLTLNKSPILPQPLFLHLLNGDNDSICHTGRLWKIYDIMIPASSITTSCLCVPLQEHQPTSSSPHTQQAIPHLTSLLLQPLLLQMPLSQRLTATAF